MMLTIGVTLAALTWSANAFADYTEHGYIKVRDGVELAYTVIRPSQTGSYPTLLNFAGYTSGSDPGSSNAIQPSEMVKAGYATIGVNVRGSGCSGGTFEVYDPRWGTDGYDVVEWIARQPWSTGKVGLWGGSFPGITQLMVAPTRPPHLRAIEPISIIGDTYRDVAFPGGIENIVFPHLWWGEQNESALGNLPPAAQQGDAKCLANWSASTAQNPPSSVPVLFAQHQFNDAFWRGHAPGSHISAIDVPALFFTQWQDEQVGGHVSVAYSQPNPSRSWVVTSNGNHAWVLCDECVDLQKRFFAWTLKGEDTGFGAVPHYQVWQESTNFTDPKTGAHGHKSWSMPFRTWPPPLAPMTLNLRAGHRLSFTGAADGESPDSYDYPRTSPSVGDPLARLEGVNGVGDSWSKSGAPGSGGLVFTSPPFSQDRVLSTASADLWLSSTAADTDVQVTLSEVRPDGSETYIERGWLRASHRKLDAAASTPLRPVQTHLESDAAPLAPGVPTPIRVEVFPFAHTIRQGSALRMIIDAPTGLTGFWGFDFLKTPAVDAAYHDPAHPSRLVVGVIPGEQARAPLPACDTLQNQPCRSSIATVPPADTAPATVSIAGTPCSRGGSVAFGLRLTGGSLRSALPWIDDLPVTARTAIVHGAPVVTLSGPMGGDHEARLALTTSSGELVTVKRAYRACAASRARQAHRVRRRRRHRSGARRVAR
jgi:putative CocE/NonD family hydrolase